MRAPQYEMARVLCAAINQVAGDLPDPIDRVEVKRDHLVISARSRRLTLRYYYVNSYAPDGCPVPGGFAKAAPVGLPFRTLFSL